MSFAKQLAKAAQVEIESPKGSGLYWRIRKVKSVDVARAGVASLRLIAEAMTGETKQEEGEEEDPMAVLRQVQRISDRALEKSKKESAAVVCAAVTHVRPPGGEWEDIAVVMEGANPDNGEINHEDLPAGVSNAVFAAVERLEKDEEEAANVIRSFPGGTGDSANG